MTTRRHTEALTKLKTDDVTIEFSDRVREKFEHLSQTIKLYPDVDEDTQAFLKSFSKKGVKFNVGVAFAAITHVVRNVTKIAAERGHEKTLDELEDLGFALASKDFGVDAFVFHTAQRKR